ncbi:MAG: hypothetical protein IJR14_03910 [Synergistaceae bacterium]|nr:hypothetical protein [Synergistaceae bacterium]
MGKKAEKETEAPIWECMKGKTVHALCEAGAWKLLRCEECSSREAGSCSGPTNISGGSPPTVLEAARTALRALAAAPSPRMLREKRLDMIAQLRDEIMEARKAGHGWRKIAMAMRGAGVPMSEAAIRRDGPKGR